MTPREPDTALSRVLEFLGGHPMVVDAVVAAALASVGFPSWPGASMATPEQAVYGLVVAGVCIALVFRRVAPLTALSLIGVLLVVHGIAVGEVTAFAMLTCLIVAYSTQTRLDAPWRWLMLAATYAGTLWVVLRSNGVVLGSEQSLGQRVAQTVWAWSVLTVFALAGAIRRQHRARVDAAIERAALLESRREAERRLAAAEERSRIAGEVHDLLGHSLNVIAVQAEGARTVLRRDPARADAALEQIAALSRGAVDEVRQVIDVLRDGDEAAPLQPEPGLRDLATLIDHYRSAGTDVTLTASGELDASRPAAAELAAYRIVQQALANAVGHAPGSRAAVELDAGSAAIVLSVRNGPGIRADRAASGREGYGIIGMRERAAAFGGSLEAGADPETGGWRVSASIPAEAR